MTRLNLETERRLQAERQINVAHRMEIVGQLAAGVAHDFNNVLMIVIGNLEMIARAAADNGGPGPGCPGAAGVRRAPV